jgi:carbon-monoxide dehydrogenase large subunit
MVAVAATAANAVAAALAPLGVQVRELPLTPTRIWAMLQDARGAASMPT